MAQQFGKHYDFCVPDDGDISLWEEVGKKVSTVDVEECQASVSSDKEAILNYARATPHGTHGLNSHVRGLAMLAQERAQLGAAAVCGMVELLNKAPIDRLLEWRNIRGRTLTHVAAIHSNILTLCFILHKTGNAQLNELDAEGNSPLALAAEAGSIHTMETLISEKADVHQQSPDGLCPLHLACASGHGNVVSLLIQSLASVSSLAKYDGVGGRQPIHVAARKGHHSVVQILANNKANLSAMTDNGATVIFHAVVAQDAETLAVLIGLRADVNAANGDTLRRTPLLGAIDRGSEAMVTMLLTAKADLAATDGEGHDYEFYVDSMIAKYGLSRSQPIRASMSSFEENMLDSEPKNRKRPGCRCVSM